MKIRRKVLQGDSKVHTYIGKVGEHCIDLRNTRYLSQEGNAVYHPSQHLQNCERRRRERKKELKGLPSWQEFFVGRRNVIVRISGSGIMISLQRLLEMRHNQ